MEATRHGNISSSRDSNKKYIHVTLELLEISHNIAPFSVLQELLDTLPNLKMQCYRKEAHISMTKTFQIFC